VARKYNITAVEEIIKALALGLNIDLNTKLSSAQRLTGLFPSETDLSRYNILIFLYKKIWYTKFFNSHVVSFKKRVFVPIP